MSALQFRTFEPRDWDESKHPRDPAGTSTGGQFTGDGGGDRAPSGGGKPSGGKHPGEGYSKHAVLRGDGSIYTTDVHDAARALYEGKKVELDQPKKVSTLIHVLGKEAERMQKQGKDAPVFNLCDVSVSGTNLFCAESKGIPRIKMPQLDREQTKKFIEYLKDKGYGIERTRELAANLRATQDELNGAKVAANMDKIESGEGKEPRLVVSRDDYILDGHHRWAAKLGLDSKDGDLTNDTKMKISRVDISITKLHEEADKFTGGKGHVAVSAEGALLFREYSPSPFELRDFDESKHPRDERGRFSETGGEGEKEPPTAFVSPNVG